MKQDQTQQKQDNQLLLENETEEKNEYHKGYEEKKARYEEKKKFTSADEAFQAYLKTKEEEITKQIPVPDISNLIQQLTNIMPLESLVDLGFYSYQKDHPLIKIEPHWKDKMQYFMAKDKKKAYAKIAFKYLSTLDQYTIIEQFLSQTLRKSQKKIHDLDNIIEKDKQEFNRAFKELYKQRELLSLLNDAAEAYNQEIKEEQEKIHKYKTKLKQGADPELEEEIFKLELKIRTKYNQLENLRNDAQNIKFKIKTWKKRYQEKEEKYTMHMKIRTNYQAVYNMFEFYAETFTNLKEDHKTAITPEDFEEHYQIIEIFKEYINYQTNTQRQQEILEEQERKLQEIYQQPIALKKRDQKNKDPESYVQEIKDIVKEVDHLAFE